MVPPFLSSSSSLSLLPYIRIHVCFYFVCFFFVLSQSSHHLFSLLFFFLFTFSFVFVFFLFTICYHHCSRLRNHDHQVIRLNRGCFGYRTAAPNTLPPMLREPLHIPPLPCRGFNTCCQRRNIRHILHRLLRHSHRCGVFCLVV